MFKSQLATLDEENQPAVQKTDLDANVDKLNKSQISKKQRRQTNQRNRKKDKENMRKIKQTEGNNGSNHDIETTLDFKNNDMGQTISM